MSYPTGSKQRNLTELDIVYDNKNDKNFNVFIGVDRKMESKSTFIVLKVSKEKKAISPKKMEKYNEAMEGMLENKPNVVRGTLLKGVTRRYVCHGIRKNMKDRKVGVYKYKPGVDKTTQNNITEDIDDLVGDIESRAIEAMKAANLDKTAGCDSFVKAQEEFGITSMNEKGRATQMALAKAYCLPAHTDKDFYYTVLSVHNEHAEPDEVLYHFCFPTYGFAVPMTKGDIIMFNPLIAHCATNPRTKTALIYSLYVSNKTCNTIVANVMDDIEK